MHYGIMMRFMLFEIERQVYLQLDELDSNTYNTYNINII